MAAREDAAAEPESAGQVTGGCTGTGRAARPGRRGPHGDWGGDAGSPEGGDGVGEKGSEPRTRPAEGWRPLPSRWSAADYGRTGTHGPDTARSGPPEKRRREKTSPSARCAAEAGPEQQPFSSSQAGPRGSSPAGAPGRPAGWARAEVPELVAPRRGPPGAVCSGATSVQWPPLPVRPPRRSWVGTALWLCLLHTLPNFTNPLTEQCCLLWTFFIG